MPGSRRQLAESTRRIAAAAPKTLFVLTAGNANIDAATVWPGSSARTDEGLRAPPNIMTIAAVDKTDRQAKWGGDSASGYDRGNTGSVTISAPGSSIITGTYDP